MTERSINVTNSFTKIVAEADSEEDINRIVEYVQQFQLDMVAMMYLQNALAYESKEIFKHGAIHLRWQDFPPP